MPNRKQRRRRQKLQRHEYEYVVETEEGEVPLSELEDDGTRQANGKGRAETSAPLDRRGRPMTEPSLQRVLKRAAIFAPILVVFVYLTAGAELEPVGVVFNAVILLAFFIPFSYLVDVMVYRMMMRRHRRLQAEKRTRR